VVGALALMMIAVALAQLVAAERGVRMERVTVGTTPVTVHVPPGGGPAPVVVVAHGFSGSRPLMRAISTSLAQAGFVAVSFDFLGHGRHPEPLRGDVTAVDGATAGILGQLAEVSDWARALPASDGRVALLGHSMAGDVIARLAVEQGEEVTATVGVSMFSPVVTADAPGNLLLIVGAWEAGLTDWALEALRDAGGPEAKPGVTYGDPHAGDARRVFFAPNVEHIGVLYSPPAIAEAVSWLNAAFGREGAASPEPRGPWVLALLGGLTALAWPLAALLPRSGAPDAGPGLRGRRFWAAALGPAVATPLLATALDWRFLPVVVGDYLALHFALYGLFTLAALKLLRAPLPAARGVLAAAPAALAAALFAIGALGLALDAHVSNFWPVAARWPLLAALAVGMAPWFVADEWLTRGAGAPGWAYPATKAVFLLSLAAATALDLERLFFLIILTPAMLLFFIVYGLFSRWAAHATGNPMVGALANAATFAWAIGVTFPMLAN
jgi:hypothetical protein